MNANQKENDNAKKTNLTRIACGIIWGRGGRGVARIDWQKRIIARYYQSDAYIAADREDRATRARWSALESGLRDYMPADD